MRRIAGRIFTVLSVVLLLATVALWARGQWGTDAGWLDRVEGAGAEIRRWRVAVQGDRGSLSLFARASVYRAEEAGRRGAVIAMLGLRSGCAAGRYGPSSLSPPKGGVARAGFLCEVWDDGPRPTVSDARPELGLPQFSQSHRVRGVAAPWWFLTAVFAVAPGWAVWRRVRPRRAPPGRCEACDYDLRATPDPEGPWVAVCPECGRATTAAGLRSSRSG